VHSRHPFHPFSNQQIRFLRYAQFIVGFHFEQGIIVPKDLSMAKKYYLSSAQQNSPDAQAALGILLVDEQQFDAGLKWLHDAARSVSTTGETFSEHSTDCLLSH
jgi:TPR repeat protein